MVPGDESLPKADKLWIRASDEDVGGSKTAVTVGAQGVIPSARVKVV